MIVSDLSETELAYRLRKGNLVLRISPFVARITSDIPSLAPALRAMYADFSVGDPTEFADFHVDVSREPGLLRWFGRAAVFKADGRQAFLPLSVGQAFACLEWGLNWCVTANMHNYLVIHAAVVERHGRCAVLPAPPGSGKSTLCAGLISNGWRLLSDELGLYDIESKAFYGMARPVNLKNASIDVIRQHAPSAVMTRAVPNTSKGTVALLRPPTDSVRRTGESAMPGWIVLPKFEAGADARMDPHPKAATLMLLAEQTFNYHIHGARGFNALCDILDMSQCYRFTYSSLADAYDAFEALLDGQGST